MMAEEVEERNEFFACAEEGRDDLLEELDELEAYEMEENLDAGCMPIGLIA